MRSEEYIGEVTPDGHISLPEKIASELGLKPTVRVRITIEKLEAEAGKAALSSKARRRALAIKDFITDLGPKDLSENLREKYK
jgi:bifunctional DNA-binding transcriptional regulator/antitoxin component of YhaV-PrlF toxin-antitoxin module